MNERTQQYTGLCKELVGRGFGVPVLFFLEMYRPLSGIFEAVGVGLHPLVSPFLGKKRCDELIELCSNGEALDEFLAILEKALAKETGDVTHGN